MSDVVITVRGEHETRIAPERAIAHLTIRAEGPERGAVVERMAALTEPVRDDLAARKSAGTVTEWTSQRVSVWSERPWNNEGKRLARPRRRNGARDRRRRTAHPAEQSRDGASAAHAHGEGQLRGGLLRWWPR